MGKTRISYLTYVANATVGCSGRGCKVQKCWAEELHNRRHRAYLRGAKLPKQYEQPFNVVQFFPEHLTHLITMKKTQRVGISFTGDLYDNQVRYAWQHAVYETIAKCPRHQFFLLTKQAANMRDSIATWTGEKGRVWPDNAWSGVSITDQEDLDRMGPDLLRIPGKKWIGIEPILDELWKSNRWLKEIDWVVVGSSNNSKRQPCDLGWIESVVEQCDAAGIPVYVKAVHTNGKLVKDPSKFPVFLQRRQLP